MRKVHIQTWGCQMNVADSERMLALLGELSYEPAERPEDADVVILNTCHIREKAHHKVISRLGELRDIKERKPELVIALGGCIPQMEGEDLAKRLPFIDLVFGTDQVESIGDLIQRAMESRGKTRVETAFDESPEFSISSSRAAPLTLAADAQASRFVNIIKGCNNFCSYCVVPYTRGREKSRAADEILAEVAHHVARGTREIVLLGQNVNSYGLDFVRQGKLDATARNPFVDLLYRVAEVPGVARMRFVTSNPHDFPDELPRAYADIPLLANDLHLPVQAGSNRVLERMNRKYTREQYLERIRQMREVRPGISFGTDFIVGFPGETDADFEDTLSLVAEVRFSYIYAFKFSPRPGTAAARLPDRVPDDVADRRLQQLLRLHQTHVEAAYQAEVGTTHEVLVLQTGPGSAHARTYAGRLVKVTGGPLPRAGETIRVRITGASGMCLEGLPLLDS